MKIEDKIDFHINVKPVSIDFDCPHCGLHQEVSWGEIDVPESWIGTWGEVSCPSCEKTVILGDYDYG